MSANEYSSEWLKFALIREGVSPRVYVAVTELIAQRDALRVALEDMITSVRVNATAPASSQESTVRKATGFKGVRRARAEEGSAHPQTMKEQVSAAPSVLDDFLSREELSKQLKVTIRTLARWKWARKGPKCVVVGGRALYRKADVKTWLATQSASDEAAVAARGDA